ncbi:response regulator [Nocardioides sp. 31GB23]|uniref:DNA-binding response OmpR family regulator n=1 Tax=Nocardioides salarius TaxID=374513 RepID=A0ABS2MGN5_9ACTN|nr:response regulator [Nocardioides salarius]MBM7510349.1 DNA-binding response OmpR family regulator [Nocardioides salarius]
MAEIMVVDDDEDIRELVELALSTEGHRVVTAPDGAAALRHLEEDQVDLAIVDVTMPVLGGIGFTAALRSLERRSYGLRPRTSVVLLSALTSPDDIDAGLAAGADGYLPKPFRIADLLRVVRVHLARRDRAQAGDGLDDGEPVEDLCGAWHGR